MHRGVVTSVTLSTESKGKEGRKGWEKEGCNELSLLAIYRRNLVVFEGIWLRLVL